MEKYKQYVDVQWWNGIDKRHIENWMRNFGENSEVAGVILDNVIFYNSAQLKAYTTFLINRMKELVYMCEEKENKYMFLEDKVLEEAWNSYIEKTKFLPAALPEDSTSSAHTIANYWRSALGRGDVFFSTISYIGKEYEAGVRRFVLVDDFSGSGKQMSEVLDYKVDIMGENIELGHLTERFADIEIIIAVYVLHEEAQKNLKQKYPKVKVMYVDLMGEEFNYLNEAAFMYEKYGVEKRKALVNEIRNLNKCILDANTELKKLSAYILNIPVVFEHGCPNNTLLLLFAHTDDWQQLFRRGEET